MAVLNTCSQVVCLCQKLEEASVAFYEEGARLCPENEEIYHSFAAEGRKSMSMVQAAYLGSISDAVEGCFAFHLEEDRYSLEASYSQPTGCAATVAQALEIERTAILFYQDAIEQSTALLPDVSRAFMKMAKKRSSHIETLESLES